MNRTLTSKASRQATRLPTARRQPFSSATVRLQRSDRDETLDPSKEKTDTIDQAKNSDGPNPAAQHASVSGHQSPQGSGDKSTQGGGQPSGGSNPGLGSTHAQQGEKPGEEAVNPAVKGRK